MRSLAAAAAAGNTTYPGAACGSNSNNGGDGWAGEGGVSVLLGLGDCLEGHSNAFLYHNATHYLRVPLPAGENKTEAAVSLSGALASASASATSNTFKVARLIRYAPDMPPRPPSPPGGPDRAYIVYIAVAVAAVGLAVAGIRALYRRKQQNIAYGRGNGAGGDGGHGSLFSSSAGAGWRSGGGASSDFGDFDAVGGGYEGTLFPADNYSSGGHSGSRSQGGGRLGNWRGRTPSEVGPLEAEAVELKRPLLNQAESTFSPEGRHSTAVSSARKSRGRGSGGATNRIGGGDGGGGGGGYGGGVIDSRRQQAGRIRGGGDRDSRLSARRADVSPPPFSRFMGTMGGGPPSGEKANRSGSGKIAGGGEGLSTGRTTGGGGGGGGGAGSQGDDKLEKGPFADDDDPFSGGNGAGRAGSLERDDQPEGDEVFC